jgi:RNA polymerase sigma-70 factor (ECF subfamily)
MIAATRISRMPMRAGVGFPRKMTAWRSNEFKGLKAKVDWAELIGRVASSGDRDAFKSLFEHFAPRIQGFMRKAGCSADEAEEIAQTTLVSVWRKAGQFDPASTGASAWIFTIARNQRIDLLRRKSRVARLGDEVRSESEVSAESPESIVFRLEDSVRVKTAVERLPEEQSRVIRLSFIEERPHPEIANELGIPLGTVKSRIRLAMNRLRDILDEEQ